MFLAFIKSVFNIKNYNKNKAKKTRSRSYSRSKKTNVAILVIFKFLMFMFIKTYFKLFEDKYLQILQTKSEKIYEFVLLAQYTKQLILSNIHIILTKAINLINNNLSQQYVSQT